jgi:hypothetical protein
MLLLLARKQQQQQQQQHESCHGQLQDALHRLMALPVLARCPENPAVLLKALYAAHLLQGIPA